MRVFLHLWHQLDINFLLKCEEVVDDLDAHLVVIRDLVLVDPVVFDVSQERALNCENVWDS